jgi:hypothetical protein
MTRKYQDRLIKEFEIPLTGAAGSPIHTTPVVTASHHTRYLVLTQTCIRIPLRTLL